MYLEAEELVATIAQTKLTEDEKSICAMYVLTSPITSLINNHTINGVESTNLEVQIIFKRPDYCSNARN